MILVGWKLYAAAGLAGAALLIGAYQTGVNAERERGEAAQLRAKLETVQRDRTIAEKALIREADAAATLKNLSQQLEDETDALRKAIAARPEGRRSPATDADLDLLYGRR